MPNITTNHAITYTNEAYIEQISNDCRKELRDCDCYA